MIKVLAFNKECFKLIFFLGDGIVHEGMIELWLMGLASIGYFNNSILVNFVSFKLVIMFWEINMKSNR